MTQMVVVGLDQDQEPILVEIGLDVYKCREYNHFAKDCLTSKLERKMEQIQKMYNMDEEQTSLKH